MEKKRRKRQKKDRFLLNFSEFRSGKQSFRPFQIEILALKKMPKMEGYSLDIKVKTFLSDFSILNVQNRVFDRAGYVGLVKFQFEAN